MIILEGGRDMAMRIFISGPVSDVVARSGYEACRVGFANAERALRTRYPEAVVQNPMDLCGKDWGWLRCMVKCIGALRTCDMMVQLQGWEESRGARMEFWIGKHLGLRMLEYSNGVIYG